MLFLLSPAKTLDYESRVPATVARKATEPQFTEQAAQLKPGGFERGTLCRLAAAGYVAEQQTCRAGLQWRRL
jgi:hypothetical protein